MIYARLFATARFIRPSSVGVPFCEAALSGTPQPMVYPQTTPTIRQTGFSSISARLVAPKLPSEGGRKKFIRSQAFPGGLMRTEADRHAPFRINLGNLDRSAQDSMGGAGDSPATFGDPPNEFPASIPQSALRIPHSDVPIQLSKSGIRSPLCLDPMLLWGSSDA
jgi:hypothetical protein